MSILTDGAILREIKAGNIVIDPFNPAQLGSNSYDVRLGRWLAVYKYAVKYKRNEIYEPIFSTLKPYKDGELDIKKDNEVLYLPIPPEGFVLKPGILYLGVTAEYTETRNLVPRFDGKSSVGRLGMKSHFTAGFCDIGFCGHITLEIEVAHRTRVYAGMPCGQICYYTVDGECLNPYDKKPSAKYANGKEDDPRPKPYAGWKNFLEPKGETNG